MSWLRRGADDSPGRHCGRRILRTCAPTAPLPSQSESWSRPAQPVGGAVPGFSENPFASPLSSSAPSAPAATMTDRAGPPWERNGASLASFIGTLKQLYTSPSAMFSEMLRGGSLWMPLGFAICGGMCGGLFNLIYDAVLPDPFQNPGMARRTRAQGPDRAWHWCFRAFW